MKVVLVGNPNVGKSSAINRITGSQIFASNYPGTSQEIVKAHYIHEGLKIDFYDTPGIYSISSDTSESRISRELLMNEQIDVVVHVVDATNLERNLVLSYELLDLSLPVVLLINQMDRVDQSGIKIDTVALGHLLNCPVISFSATSGQGVTKFLDLLKKEANGGPTNHRNHDTDPKEFVLLDQGCGCSGNCSSCSIKVENCATDADYQRAQKAKITASKVMSSTTSQESSWMIHIEHILDHPIFGTIILLVLAYLGFVALMRFIGISEGPITSLLAPINSGIEALIHAALPAGFLTNVLAKAIPEGLLIPFTIILPAMLMVSFLMAVVEDSGILPRYSVALERVGRVFGVSGQAVIPLSLGFGCRTPAVVAARVLPNETQRFIVITMLSIVIPCAATVGIMATVSAKFHASLLVIVGTMFAVMIILGSILSRLMPQENVFVYELPPLRVPKLSNLWSKVKIRFAGFFTEVLPLLLIMSIGIRALMESGLLESFRGMDGISHLLFGIPAEALVSVLITIFQRYLAPLVLLNLALTPREATIAISMIALSLPCLPVMVMTVRELGVKSLLKIVAMGFTTSFCVGFVLNLLLPI